MNDYPRFNYILEGVVKFDCCCSVLISVAYLTLLERKVMASIQRRRGPSVVGIFGLLQPFSDGLKLFVKEIFTG